MPGALPWPAVLASALTFGAALPRRLPRQDVDRCRPARSLTPGAKDVHGGDVQILDFAMKWKIQESALETARRRTRRALASGVRFEMSGMKVKPITLSGWT